MDASREPVVVLVTIIFLIVVVSLTRTRKRRTSNRIPPGSVGLPLVGETFSLMKPCAITEVGDFMKQRMTRYGKIFASNLMGLPTVVSADGELNRLVLKNRSGSFRSRKSPARRRLLGRWGLSSTAGDAYKNMKTPVLEFLGGERVRTTFLEDADRLASLVLGSWRDGSTISAKAEATKFSLYIMAKKVASMTPDDNRLEKLASEYVSFCKGIISIPWYVPGTVYWKAVKSRENILSIFREESKERLKKDPSKTRTEETDDFLGWFTKNPSYSPEQVGDLALGMLFAGYDTSAKEITSMIYFLEGRPRAIKKLREEHLEIASAKEQRGESKLVWDDYKSMEFTKCVINETLRLTNAAPFLLREACKDVDFKGYVIPQGWEVLAHITAVHLDPSHFHDPQQFNPWRWLDVPGKSMTDNFMPFGCGTRMCPGAELARVEMAVFLHHLVLKYDWELAEPVDVPVRKPLIEFRKGLPIEVRSIST